MSNFIVLYDSCVLYPAPLRDLLMHLALTDLFRAKWTNDIHDEWMRNVLANRPDLSSEQLNRTRDLMNKNVRDCLVTEYEKIINTLSLPDPNDRHVLAAAIRANAAVIVTYNLKDFPIKTTAEFEIEPQHPDDFISYLLDFEPEKICRAIQRHRLSLKNPPLDREDYLYNFEVLSLNKTINKLRGILDAI